VCEGGCVWLWLCMVVDPGTCGCGLACVAVHMPLL